MKQKNTQQQSQLQRQKFPSPATSYIYEQQRRPPHPAHLLTLFQQETRTLLNLIDQEGFDFDAREVSWVIRTHNHQLHQSRQTTSIDSSNQWSFPQAHRKFISVDGKIHSITSRTTEIIHKPIERHHLHIRIPLK